MKNILLTILRDRSSSLETYRQAADRLAYILAAESGRYLQPTKTTVQTPMGTADGSCLPHDPVLVPIIRSGLIFLPPFLQIYPKAPVGLIGIRRDETTAIPQLYYNNLPHISSDAPVFLLEPMIATGGSALLAVQLLQEAGAKETNIVLVSVLAAQEGVERFTQRHPGIQTQIVHVDPKLNPHKMILPGLGDFGDRYFAT